jgi:transcriptional regulator with XRE-family HTH domain
MMHVMTDGVPIGVRIKRRRQVLGMRQEDLARKLGVSRGTVATWEAGKHFPLRKLGAVEAVLGISLDEQPEAVPYPHVPSDVAEYVRRRWRRDPAEAAAVLSDLEAVFSQRLRQEQAPGEDGQAARQRAV